MHNRVKIFTGKCFSNVPVNLIGVGTFLAQQRKFEEFSIYEKREYLFLRVKEIVNYAMHNIPFYRDFYSQHGFSLDQLKSFDDIQRIPIITKTILNKYPIEYRTARKKIKIISNTGGSSGTPLSFYRHPLSKIKEMAYMYKIWEKLGYHRQDLKLQFVGRNSLRHTIDYDWMRNSLLMGLNKSIEGEMDELEKWLNRYNVRFLHGYPSSIYEFAQSAVKRDGAWKENLIGAFLSSEYPNPILRNYIEKSLGIKTVSWYGHSEQCVLAYEKYEKYEYVPFHSYGFSESIKKDKDNDYLLGTSFDNFVAPFIRYNTEDIISDVNSENGLISSFRISQGRNSEYILDINNRKVYLTGFVFGRHHKIFDVCEQIQIYQDKPGHAIILYVNKEHSPIRNVQELFDTRNVDIQFDFCNISVPIKTNTGKVNILVRNIK